MGSDELGEKDKMARNTWIEEQITSGTFGEPGAGLEAVAAGGLHTLFIDEKGTVRQIFVCLLNLTILRFGRVATMTKRRSDELRRTCQTQKIQART